MTRIGADRAGLSRLAALAVAGLACFAVIAEPAAAQRRQAPLVRIPIGSPEGSLTPYTFHSAYALVTLVYDTLLWRDERGVPRPWLARSVRTSAGGRRLTVRLARGARWHDGKPLTAADVAFTFEYMQTHEHPRFTPQLRALAGVDVVARDRLVIRLRRPSPGFRDQPLADVPILPRHIWSQVPAGRLAPAGLPVGSGPYRLVGREHDGGYRFAASRRYFLGRPAVRRIEVPIVPDERAVSRGFERGDLDLVSAVPESTESGLLEARGIGFERGTSYVGTVLVFNLRRAPFDSLRVRRAVARSLDLARIARGAAGPGAVIVPARRGYLHPESRWAPREDLHAFDVDDARLVLAGRALRVLAAPDEHGSLNAGREVVRSLRRAGARATLVRRSLRGLAAAIGRDASRPAFDLAVWTSAPLAAYDPDFLRVEFGTGGRLNYAGYRSAAFERLADRVASTAKLRARRAAVAAELRLLARDLPVVPLFFEEGLFAFRRGAYDRWVYIEGSGPLDKRSFVGRTPRRAPGTIAAAPADDPGPASIGALGVISLGLLGLALLIVVVGSLRRRE